MTDVFTIDSDALPSGTCVVGFRGTEGISRPYAFEIHLTIGADHSDDFDLAGAMGAKATLTLDRRDGRPPFLFHGIFSEASLVHHQPDGRALLRAVLVPQLWRLTQTLHSRIFTNQAIPDIFKEILKDGGLTSDDYELKLSQQYKPEEHVCQYHESDFDFISRWMEREGLYYYFEQGDDREKLVITDHAAAHEDLVPAPVRYFALVGADASAKECLETFVCRHRSLPANVRFKDHDYTKPSLDVSGAEPVSKIGLGDINVHGARFFTPDAGKRLAKTRAEEIQSREVVYTGSGTSFYLRAGYTFTLEDHPRASFDAPYLVTEVEHYGNQGASTRELKRLTGLEVDEVYRVDVTAIPKTTQFRAELRTTWPRIYGTEHGVVDGEADSEYAQIDEHGRYAVRFAFDESGLEDGKASTRVRMMQPHGGEVEGWHFPLRKGTEVLFTFLGGDPDRPVIAGVVPNAHTPSAVTRANYTRNVIQTGGRNRFELEDKKGFERITLSTPHSSTMIRMGSGNEDHNMIVRTEGTTLLHTGQDMDVNVEGDLIEQVKADVLEIYGGKQESRIKGTWTHTVTAKGWMNFNAGLHEWVNGRGDQNVTGDWTHTVSDENHDKYGTWKTDVTGTWKATIGGNVTLESTGGTVTITSPTEITLAAPKVTSKAEGSFVDFYGSKNSMGIQKLDCCAIAMSTNGLKMDATAVSMSVTGAKIDKTEASLSSATVKVDLCGFKFANNPVTLSAEELELRSGAFLAVTKAFMKLG